MSLPRIAALIVSCTFLPSLALAQEGQAIPAPAADGNAPVTRQELPALVKEALMNDPKMIMEAIEKMRSEQRAEAEKKTMEAIAANKESIYNDPASPSIGNPKGDVTIVEFFDYHCGYCKHMLPVVAQLVADDPKVRVVFKEFPILSEDSVKAARAAIAVNRIAKDKYFAFHSALMKFKGKFEEKDLTDMATEQGIDAAAMIKEMSKDEVTAELDKSRKLGELLGISGTPAFIMNDYFLPGAADLESMKKMVANVRAGKRPDYSEDKGKKAE